MWCQPRPPAWLAASSWTGFISAWFHFALEFALSISGRRLVARLLSRPWALSASSLFAAVPRSPLSLSPSLSLSHTQVSVACLQAPGNGCNSAGQGQTTSPKVAHAGPKEGGQTGICGDAVKNEAAKQKSTRLAPGRAHHVAPPSPIRPLPLLSSPYFPGPARGSGPLGPSQGSFLFNVELVDIPASSRASQQKPSSVARSGQAGRGPRKAPLAGPCQDRDQEQISAAPSSATGYCGGFFAGVEPAVARSGKREAARMLDAGCWMPDAGSCACLLACLLAAAVVGPRARPWGP